MPLSLGELNQPILWKWHQVNNKLVNAESSGSSVDISDTQAPSCLKTLANYVVLSFRTRGLNSSGNASLILKCHRTQNSLPSHTALKTPLKDGSASFTGVWIRGIMASFGDFNLNLCVVTYLMEKVKKMITCVCVWGVNSERYQQSLKSGTSWNDGLGTFLGNAQAS